MSESRTVALGIVAAILLAATAGAVVGAPTAFGLTPLGVAIYAIVGLGIPQGVLASRTDSRLRGGLAAVAVVGGLAALGYGLVDGTLTSQTEIPFTGALLVAIVAALLVGSARSFYQGLQATAE